MVQGLKAESKSFDRYERDIHKFSRRLEKPNRDISENNFLLLLQKQFDSNFNCMSKFKFCWWKYFEHVHDQDVIEKVIFYFFKRVQGSIKIVLWCQSGRVCLECYLLGKACALTNLKMCFGDTKKNIVAINHTILKFRFGGTK